MRMLEPCALACVWTACFFGLLTASACGSNDCAAPSRCDIRDVSCQHDVMSWVSCQRGGSADLPPGIVVSASQYVERQAEPQRAANPDRTEEDDAKDVGWNHGLAQFELGPETYDRDVEHALQRETFGTVYEPRTRSVCWAIRLAQRPSLNEQVCPCSGYRRRLLACPF